MANTYYFNSKKILDIKFEKDVKGYNPLEVDKTLDLIIEDYKKYESQCRNMYDYIKELETSITKLKNENKEYEVEIAKCKNRVSNIDNSKGINKDNLYLLNRISLLEKELYKLGGSPDKIK